jgi:hypothetical protein
LSCGEGCAGSASKLLRWARAYPVSILEETNSPHWRAQLCSPLLPAAEVSLTGSSVVSGNAKFLRGSGDGSIEGKAERDRLIGMGNPTLRKKNWEV